MKQRVKKINQDVDLQNFLLEFQEIRAENERGGGGLGYSGKLILCFSARIL